MIVKAMIFLVRHVFQLLILSMSVFADDLNNLESIINLTELLSKSWQIQSTDIVIDLERLSDEALYTLNANLLQPNRIDNLRIIHPDSGLFGDSLTRDQLTVIASKSWRPTSGKIFSGGWLIPSNVYLEPESLRFDSLIYKYDIDKAPFGNITVSETYTFKQGSGVVHKADIGYVDAERLQFIYTSDEFIWERRCNLEGMQLTAVYNEYQPLSYHLADGTLGGAFVDFAKVFADSMNFTLNFTEQPDGKWGSMREDGTWSGMVGSLVEKKADLALSGLRVTQVT